MSGFLNIVHHSLNGGEVSERAVARMDRRDKYLSWCEKLLNWVPVVVGGAYVRPGWQLVAEAKTVAGHPFKAMAPFVPSRDAAYVLEFGHEYIRFFRDGEPLLTSGLVPYEVTTPYADTDLAEVFIGPESIDVMYLLHPNYPPHKLSRITPTEFTLTVVNFNPPATQEEEPTGADLGLGTLTPSATTGDSVNFTAANTGFLAADVGRLIVFGASRAIITAIASSSDVAIADIIDDFPDTNPIPEDEWRLVLSPQTTLDITDKRKEVGQIATLTATDAAFRAADVGKWITMFGGLLEITNFTDSTHVRAIIRSTLTDIDVDNPDPTRAWTLEIAAWSATEGYPTCGCFHENRLWLCKGLTVNASVSGDFENFAKGAGDDAAIARTISDDDIDAIKWIVSQSSLKVGTGSGIFNISPTTNGGAGALTQTSFKAELIDSSGVAPIKPLRVSPVLIYVDASLREMRELSYSFAEDRFQSPHLFRLADHLMDGFYIVGTAAAANPDNRIYAVRSDGALLSLIYEGVEGVIGWAPQETQGKVKNVALIPRPSTGADWLWGIIERDNGTFIEYQEPNHPDTGREWASLYTDAAVVAVPDANFVVSGLDHLEGQRVWVIADGMLSNVEQVTNSGNQRYLQSTAIVTAGAITLDPPLPASKVEVGLGYEAILIPVEPPIPEDAGGPFIARSYVDIGIRFRRTLGLTLRAYRVGMTEPGDDEWIGEHLVYRKAYHPMDQQIPLQKGKKCVTNMGNDPFSRIEVRQRLPLPAEVLNVVGKLQIGDRWDCEAYNDPVVEEVAVAAVVAFGHCLTPFMSAFPWDDTSGFGAKYTDPSTLPESATSDLAFSPAGDAVGVATYFPFDDGIGMRAWAWADGWGAKYADPATTPNPLDLVNVWGVAFSPNGDIAYSVEDSPPRAAIYAYPWDSITGFGAKYADPATLPQYSSGRIAFSPAGDALISTRGSGSPYVEAYAWTEGVGFGTKYADPGSPPATFNSAKGIAFSPSGVDVAITYSVTPWVGVYPWDAVTGFGAKYADPATLPAGGYGRDVEFSPSGQDIAIAHHTSPYVTAYPWTEGGGFGVKYADPATLPGNQGISLGFSPSGGALLVGSANPSTPLVTAYEWTPGIGFGAKYTDTAAVLPDDATAIAFR